MVGAVSYYYRKAGPAAVVLGPEEHGELLGQVHSPAFRPVLQDKRYLFMNVQGELVAPACLFPNFGATMEAQVPMTVRWSTTADYQS